MARWEFTGGPSAQNITTVFVDEHGNGHLLAGLSTGEVHSSADGGFTWTKLSTIPAHARIFRFIQHPDNAQQLFAATDSGLFISMGAGKTWSEMIIDAEAVHRRVRSIVIEPYNTRVMYTGLAGRGIYKSTDGGNSWRPINNGIDSVAREVTDLRDIVIDPSRPDKLFAAIKGVGIVRSTDRGETWVKISAIVGSNGVTPTSLVLNRKSPLTLCFGMEAGNIYKSTDGGETWSPTRFGSGSDRPVRLVSHPGDAEKLYAGTENDLLMSTDFGSTWKSIANGIPHVATSIAVASLRQVSTLFAYGEGIGFARSINDGASWNIVRAQVGGSTVVSMAGNRRGDALYAAIGASVHQWKDQAQAWSSASNGLAGGAIASVAVDAESSSMVYAATLSGVFSSFDGGMTWTSRSPQLRGKPVALIAAHPVFRTRLLAESDKELFVSTDNGMLWSPAKPLNERYRLRSLTFSNTDAGFVLGATGNGVILSTNGGLSWESNRYGLESNEVVSVTMDEKDKQTLYAWTVNGAGFRSTNKGIVWDRYTPPWRADEPATIVIDHYNPSNIVALVGAGRMFYSSSGGATWLPIPTGLLQGEPMSTYWNSTTSMLYVGIRDTGVYRLSVREYLKKLFGE